MTISAATPVRQNRWHAAMVALLMILTGATFFPALRGSFVVWDDDRNVVLNPDAHGLTWPHVEWAFTNFEWTRRYQPLAWISWQFDYSVGRLSPFGYHLGNVLQHLGCVILLYFVVFRLLKVWQDRQELKAGGGVLAAAAATGTLFWAIHPLRAEAVAWVTGRNYTQCALFMLGAFLCYLHSVDGTRSKGLRRSLYALSIVLFACSLLTYAIVVGAAFALLLVDFYPLRRIGPGSEGGWFSGSARRVYLEKVPYLLVALGVGLITIWARVHVVGIWKPPPTLAEFPLYSRVMQAFYTWAYYIWIVWKPFHLAPVYTRLIGFDPNDSVFLLSALFVVTMTAVGIACYRRYPGVTVLWGFHLVMLIPLLGFSEYPHYTNDRYEHMEGWLWAVLVGGIIVKVATRRDMLKRIVPVAMGLLVLSFGVVCYGQELIWTNTETLFRGTLQELGNEPYAAEIHRRLGDFYRLNGRIDEAIDQYNAALEIVPSYGNAVRGKALAVEARGHAATSQRAD